MQILVMGGTGAIGKELVFLLSKNTQNSIVVTSRYANQHKNTARIKYISGNAKDLSFIINLINTNKFDIIIDFMLYSTGEFKERYEYFLRACNQYIFLSSARVYSASNKPLIETSARLLDVSNDYEFLHEGEYSLKKAMQEDILFNSKYNNWVIIRPYKTYSKNRLQLGVLEMEQWIYRAIRGKTVVVLGDIGNLYTSLTDSKDTAKILAHIIGNYRCNGEVFQIANPEAVTWNDIIGIYSKCIEKKYGKRINIYFLKNTKDAEEYFSNKYRLKYDGVVNRFFSDDKVCTLIEDDFKWTPIEIGLTRCIKETLESLTMDYDDYGAEGLFDRLTGQYMELSEIMGYKNKIKYCLYRTLRPKRIRRFKRILRFVK